MIFKIIALIAAAIPIFLFVRSIFFRRTTRINEGLREFKKQAKWAELSLHSRRWTDCPAMARPAVLDSFSHFPHINTRLVHIYRV